MEHELQLLADELLAILDRQQLSICTAESITAGYLCAKIAKASGISRWLRGGLVCYQSSIKTQVLGIPAEIVSFQHAVNEQVAQMMAQNVAGFFNAQIGISTTGFAEPFESYLPQAYIGIFISGQDCSVQHIDLKEVNSREDARLLVVKASLTGLIRRLS